MSNDVLINQISDSPRERTQALVAHQRKHEPAEPSIRYATCARDVLRGRRMLLADNEGSSCPPPLPAAQNKMSKTRRPSHTGNGECGAMDSAHTLSALEASWLLPRTFGMNLNEGHRLPAKNACIDTNAHLFTWPSPSVWPPSSFSAWASLRGLQGLGY